MTSQSQLTVSAPFWGFARRHHLGGPALIMFALLLWALFLGTLPTADDRTGVAALRIGGAAERIGGAADRTGGAAHRTGGSTVGRRSTVAAGSFGTPASDSSPRRAVTADPARESISTLSWRNTIPAQPR